MRVIARELLLRRYLLMDLPENKRDELEAKYLADEEAFEELLAVENDLIDAYVQGGLDSEDNRKFELAYSASPERRERVAFARSLDRVSSTARLSFPVLKSSPWRRALAAMSVQLRVPRWAVAAAVALVLLSGSWLLVQNVRLRDDMSHASSAQAGLLRDRETLPAQIAPLGEKSPGPAGEDRSGGEIARLEPPAGSEAVFELSGGNVRSMTNGKAALTISPVISRVRLVLQLDPDVHDRYEAALSEVDGRIVLASKSLRGRPIPGAVLVEWVVPANSLHSGDFVIELSGLQPEGAKEALESYSFRVLRR